MKKTILIIAALVMVGCGGDDVTGVQTVTDEVELVDIEISESNESVDVRSNQKVGEVTISGSNNSVTFSSIPISIVITGNDNTVYKPNDSSLSDRGDGNVIIEQGG